MDNRYLSKFRKKINFLSLKTCDVFMNIFNLNKEKGFNNEILVVHVASLLGDFIMLIPTLLFLREQYPDKKITLFMFRNRNIKKGMINAYDDLPWVKLLPEGVIDDVILLRDKTLKGVLALRDKFSATTHPCKAYLLSEREIPAKFTGKVIIALRLLGVRCKIIGWKHIDDCNWQYELQYRERVLDLLGSVLEDPKFKSLKNISVPYKYNSRYLDDCFADTIWTQYNIQGKVIVLNLGGKVPHRTWPLENFIALAKLICEQYKVTFILTGIIDDKVLGNKFENEFIGSAKIVNLIGKTNLFQLASILKKADVLICSDGGSMHLADIIRTPSVTIFPGIKYPNSTGPWLCMQYSVRKDLPCMPCFNNLRCPLGTNECMRAITPDEVYSMFLRIEKNQEEQNDCGNESRIFKISRMHNIIDFKRGCK